MVHREFGKMLMENKITRIINRNKGGKSLDCLRFTIQHFTSKHIMSTIIFKGTCCYNLYYIISTISARLE